MPIGRQLALTFITPHYTHTNAARSRRRLHSDACLKVRLIIIADYTPVNQTHHRDRAPSLITQPARSCAVNITCCHQPTDLHYITLIRCSTGWIYFQSKHVEQSNSHPSFSQTRRNKRKRCSRVYSHKTG